MLGAIHNTTRNQNNNNKITDNIDNEFIKNYFNFLKT